MKITVEILVVILQACLLITLSSAQPSSESPGLRLKVSSTGLNLVKDVVLDVVRDELNVIDVPTFTTKQSGFTITLSGLKLSNLNLASTNVATRHPNIFTPSISGGSLELRGGWRASGRLNFGFFRRRISEDGRISGRASGISLSHDVNVGVNSEGKPTFRPGRCQARIQSLNVRLSGSRFNSILNLILRLFRGQVRRFVEGRICPALTSVIRKEGDRLTSRFNPITCSPAHQEKTNLFVVFYTAIFRFPSNTRISLGLASQPNVDSSSVSVTAVGRCFSPTQNPSQSFNFQAPVLPALSRSSKMASISISSYVMNTFLVSLWQNQLFIHRLSQNEFVQAVGLDLLDSPNEVDYSGYGSGDFFSSLPALLAESPNFLEVIINATSPPIGSISPGGIVVRGTFSVAINIDEGGDYGEGFFPLFDPIVFNFIGNASVSASGNKLSASISGVSAVVAEASEFPDDIIAGINEILTQIIPSDILPGVNSLIESGFELQEYFGYTTRDPKVELKTNALEITSDFIHS